MEKNEPGKTDRQGLACKRKRSLRRGLNDAIDRGLEATIDVITPRWFVAVMTMSSVELGHAFKCALRDELYEARRRRKS